MPAESQRAAGGRSCWSMTTTSSSTWSSAISRPTATRSLTAGSVDAARRLLAGGTRPALLILDINLPDDSGWSLLRDGSLAAAGSPPVVIMSGTQIRPERLREFHVAGYLPKPVSMALLTSCIDRFINEPGAARPGRLIRGAGVNDLEILLIAVVAVVAVCRLPLAV